MSCNIRAERTTQVVIETAAIGPLDDRLFDQRFGGLRSKLLIEQAVIERAERGSFEDYLRRTLGPDIA